MRLDGKIEKSTGKAILLLDVPTKNPDCQGCYTHTGQHFEGQRSYFRSQCRNPKTMPEMREILGLIKEWANLPH